MSSVAKNVFKQKSPRFPGTACGVYAATRPELARGARGLQCDGSAFPPALAAAPFPPQTPSDPSAHFFEPTIASLTFALASRSSCVTDRRFASHPTTHPLFNTSTVASGRV